MNQQPGRELDKQVAVIMGYDSFWQDKQTGEWYAFHPDHTNLEDERIPVPRYSTDGYAAWEAWEWLEATKPWKYKHVVMGLSNRGEGWGDPPKPSVIIYEPSDYPVWNIEREIEGDTYPHAICLAILASRELVDEPNK